ncbi:DUF7537 family lipoprotein [Halorarius litoreus]|uniref:DUF7537 family lipoprotein n=1 Tax=Halorarius litoreus TaxID=2962676 RepID=UPI0020CDDD2A|nr:hypothetical protein [Halorarius litoreus]
MRRTFAAVGLALLLALSGCSFLGGPGTATDAGGLTADTAPPGVSADSERLENETALVAAHTDRLVDTGFRYELRSNATVVQQGEPRQVRRQQVTRVAPGRTQYNYTTVNPGSRFDVWGNESVQAVKVQFGDQVQYRTGEAAAAASLTGQNVFVRYLSSGEWAVTNVTEREGTTTLVTLESSTPPTRAGALPRNATDVRDYEARIVVDGEGRVYQFVTSGTYTIDDTEGSFQLVYVLRSLDDPGVTKPQWADEALSQSG